MKKIAAILVIIFAFTFNTQAQKKKRYKKLHFTIEQQTNLKVKQMTLALDLSDKQQRQITPLLKAEITAKHTFMKKRKVAKKEKKRPTSNEIYAMKIQMLENQIAMRSSMKDFLNPDQFQEFKKRQKSRMIKKKSKKLDKEHRKIEK
jgi:thiol:disulfide interchange protein